MVPAGGDLPVLEHVKGVVEPMLTWAPEWLRATVWAALVFALLFGLLLWLVHTVLPWAGRVLPDLVAAALNGVGVVLVLPEYLATAALRRLDVGVPGVLFGYGDLVQTLVTGAQRATRSGLTGLSQLSRLSKRVVALMLLLVFVTWNGTYCNGRGRCENPVGNWAQSFTEWQRELGADDR